MIKEFDEKLEDKLNGFWDKSQGKPIKYDIKTPVFHFDPIKKKEERPVKEQKEIRRVFRDTITPKVKEVEENQRKVIEDIENLKKHKDHTYSEKFEEIERRLLEMVENIRGLYSYGSSMFVSVDGANFGSFAGFNFCTETPQGLVNGTNRIYTTVNIITYIFGLWINGQFIHPSDYTYSGTTITIKTSATLDATLAGLPFTVKYI